MTGIPTWVKLTPNVTDITVIGKAAERGGACAIVAINTVKAMRISTGMQRPVLGNRYGGLSGTAVFPIAVRCVYELYETCKIPIIGCGGVTTADNVIEMMMAGASAVEIGSAVYNDVKVFETIKADLYRKDGIPPGEIIGCAHGVTTCPVPLSIVRVKEETELIRTFVFDRSFVFSPGQFVMVWVPGVDEIPMALSSENTITVQKAGDATSCPVHSGFRRQTRNPGSVWQRVYQRGKSPCNRRRHWCCSPPAACTG